MKFYTFVISLALALLVSCPQTPQPNAMTAEDARSLKTLVPLAMNGFANSVRSGGANVVNASSPLTPLGLRPQAVSGSCGSATPPTDADQDKIPANFAYNYDCTVTVGSGFKFIAKGSFRSLDTDDTNPNSGFSTDGNIRYDFIFTNTQTNESSGFAFVAFWTATATIGQNGGYNINTDQRLTFQPDTDKSQFGYQANTTYAPDNDGNALKFDAGTLNIAGSVNFRNAKGKFSLFNLTVTNLHFGNACPRAVDAGTVRTEDASNIVGSKSNVLVLTATACDVWSATYNSNAVF